MKEPVITGIIPAAGTGSRLTPLPFSKELYPINLDTLDADHPNHPKTVMHYLLDDMKNVADSVLVIIRDGKWDIPAYFGDGSRFGVPMGYLMMGLPYGPPFTIDQAYPFVKDHIIVLGFPDILVSISDSFHILANKLKNTNADAVAGLYKVTNPKEWDMVKIDHQGIIEDIIIKREHQDYEYAWATIAWKPVLTEFLHNYLKNITRANIHGRINEGESSREIIMSDVLGAAIKEGIQIKGHIFDNVKILDVGTKNGIIQSQQFFND